MDKRATHPMPKYNHHPKQQEVTPNAAFGAVIKALVAVALDASGAGAWLIA